MEFCPDCGMRLVSSREKKAKKDVFRLVCQKCGYTKHTENNPVVPKAIERSPQESIAVIGKEEQKLRTLPTVRVECPKCGNHTASAWQVQTRCGYKPPQTCHAYAVLNTTKQKQTQYYQF